MHRNNDDGRGTCQVSIHQYLRLCNRFHYLPPPQSEGKDYIAPYFFGLRTASLIQNCSSIKAVLSPTLESRSCQSQKYFPSTAHISPPKTPCNIEVRSERCMNEGRWVLLIASEVGGTDSVSDRAMERLVDAIEQEGYEVVRTSTPEDGLSLVTSDPSHSAILLDWDLEGDNQFDERAALEDPPRRSSPQQEGSHLPHRRPHPRQRTSPRSRQAGPRVHPPLRRHSGLHRQPRRLRRRALPRAASCRPTSAS